MNSLRYFILLSVLKLKGIKKKFSQTIIDFHKLRKEDVHIPKTTFFKNTNIKTFRIFNSTITEIDQNTNKLILFIHGGAFVSGPGKHHWKTIKSIAKQVNQTIWLCNYPKAPEHKITEISDNIDAIYNYASLKFETKNISVIGDSVGATLTISLIQRLVNNNVNLPSKIFLISPVLDCSMSNPGIDMIESNDPMLSRKGVVSANSMCSDDGNLKNPKISPIFGSFENFPLTYLFMAENDITFPDQKILDQKLKESKIKHSVIIGEKMPHIWPLLPLLKESKSALNKIIMELKKSD